MTHFTYDDNIYSDLYKEVFGSRPRAEFDAWVELAPEEKQVKWDQLLDMHEEELARDREEKAWRLQELKERIEDTINLGAGDVKTALKWIIEAEEFDEYDLMYGADYFCYHFGIDYLERKNFPIQEVINEM